MDTAAAAVFGDLVGGTVEPKCTGRRGGEGVKRDVARKEE